MDLMNKKQSKSFMILGMDFYVEMINLLSSHSSNLWGKWMAKMGKYKDDT